MSALSRSSSSSSSSSMSVTFANLSNFKLYRQPIVALRNVAQMLNAWNLLGPGTVYAMLVSGEMESIASVSSKWSFQLENFQMCLQTFQ